jgi:putative tricarboxylic transport membrane protein
MGRNASEAVMTMSDKTSNILFGAAFLALGVYVAQGALNWAVYGHDGPGPGFFPLLYGSLMIFFGGALALGAMVKA